MRRLTRSDSSACPAAMLGTLVAGVGRRLRLCGVQSSEGRKAGGDARPPPPLVTPPPPKHEFGDPDQQKLSDGDVHTLY